MRIIFNFARILLLVVLTSVLVACGGGGGGGGATSSTNGGPVPNTVSGTATFNGAPLADVTITVWNTNTNPSNVFAIVTTDADGNYSIPDLPTGCSCISNYNFVASKPGYSFNPFMANNPSGNRADYLWNPQPQNWYSNTGAVESRAGANGVYDTASGSSPILFNVINYDSVTNNNVTGANFAAYNGSNPLVALAATGQQTSYAGGDDASLHEGVAWPAKRYVDNGDGTVTDNLTGLVWLKNANCFTPAIWPTALADVNALASGACGLSDGSTAGQWRLPNLVELESMIDVSASNPAVTAGSPFINVSNGIYWSSTPVWGGQLGSNQAWVIRFADGAYFDDNINNVMASSVNAVWAVKGTSAGAIKLQATGTYIPSGPGDDGTIEAGVPLPAPRMVDNGNGTVTDTLTGLVWLKEANCINQPWSAAIAAVNGLASGQCGLSDGSVAGNWRMPNRKEMQSLADRIQTNEADYFDQTFLSNTVGLTTQQAIFNNFITLQFYWTSTTDAADPTAAWTVFSCDFGVYATAKANTGYTLAVRN